MNQNVNTLLAIILSVIIILGWNHLYEKPLAKRKIEQQKILQSKKIENNNKIKEKQPIIIDRNQSIKQSERITFENDHIKGSINLKGARIDDLMLKKYRETIKEDSNNIKLLSPSNTKSSAFIDIGWLSKNQDEKLPNSDSQWRTTDQKVEPGKTTELFWTNEDGVKFIISFTFDDQYMIKIKQTIENQSAKPIFLHSYGLINQSIQVDKINSSMLVHEGPIGHIDNKLIETTYTQLKKNKKQLFSSSYINWLGITDKYWLTSLIPSNKIDYKSSFHYTSKNNQHIFQVDLIGMPEMVQPKYNHTNYYNIFVGPKRLSLLEKYSDKYNIILFDRAVDFGWFYIFTKPLFSALEFFYQYTGNFGVSILIVTVIVRLLLFGITNKSLKSMKILKTIQPKIEEIKTLYAHDKSKISQETIKLYKKYSINPVSGCLPILIQVPIFFAIYKVLNVTIEMRHAPFFWWIQDLSARDPSNIFSLFGIVSLELPKFLHLGIWPIIMSVTMFLQQKLSPSNITDETQAQIIKIMPLIFLIPASNLPAGLIIYWSWSNILSSIQQYYINKDG